MNKLNFEIFIGSKMVVGQAENIVAIVKPQFFIPEGRYYLNGSEKQNEFECFTRIYDLGTYIADWIDFVEDEKKISAMIHLNIYSLKKIFKGKEILSIINAIDKNRNYQIIRDFNKLIY